MSYGRSKREAQGVQERDPRLCHADHCPLIGTTAPGNGHYFCHCHAYAKPENWREITEALHSNEWLVGFCSDIHKMRQWREFAGKFWSGMDDFMLPTQYEDLSAYWARCMEELEYRVGARSKRPKPRPPIERKPAMAGSLGGTLKGSKYDFVRKRK